MINRSRISDPGPLGVYDDASRRCADTVNLHIHADRGNVGKYVAIRLSDGGSDNTVYNTKADAVNHQLHETQCAYVRIPPDGMTVAEAASYLQFNRNAYDAGFRLSDPDFIPTMSPSSTYRKELF